DAADPAVQRQLIETLDRETAQHGLVYHELRHRNVGDALWIELHLVFPDHISLREAHQIATTIEERVEEAVPLRAHVTTHLESMADHDQLHQIGRAHV